MHEDHLEVLAQELESLPGALSAPERQIVQLIRSDELREHFRFVDPAQGQEGKLASGSQDPLRASFVRHLCLGLSRSEIDVHALIIDCARIVGNLDLHETELTLQLAFRWCLFERPVDISHSKIRTTSFRGSSLSALYARRTEINGSLYLNRRGDPFLSHMEGAKELANHHACTVRFVTILSGAVISGNLNCDESTFGQELPPEGASYMVGEEAFDTFHADGLTVNGHARFRRNCRVHGTLNLRGSTIGRDLVFSGAKLTSGNGCAVRASDLTVNGNVSFDILEPDTNGIELVSELVIASEDTMALQKLLPYHTYVSGVIELHGTEVLGGLYCSGALFRHNAPDSPEGSPNDEDKVAQCLSGSGLKVHGSVFFNDGFRAIGEVQLLNARVYRDFYCHGGWFDSHGALALTLDGIVIEGTMMLDIGGHKDRRHFRTNGIVRFVHATVGQGFVCDGGEFLRDWGQPSKGGCGLPEEAWFRPGDRGVDLRHCKIEGRFRWLNVESDEPAENNNVNADIRPHKQEFRVDMYGTTVDFWQHDESGFPLVAGNLDIRRFHYKDLKTVVRANGGRLFLLKQLMHHYCHKTTDENRDDVGRFDRMPFLHLARVLRNQGRIRLANDVSITQEVGATLYGEYSLFERYFVRKLILSWFLGYGYRPSKLLGITLLWWAFSVHVFNHAFLAGQIVPLVENMRSVDCLGIEDCGVPAFNAVAYATDLLLPIADLRQAEFHQARGFWPSLLVLLNQVWGWLAGSLLVASLTGIIRKE